MLIHFFFCNIFSLNLGRPLEKFSYSIHVKYCYGPLSEMYNRIVKCAKHHIPHFDKKASINNSHLLSQCLPDALLNVTSSPPLFLLIKIMWAVLVQITHKDSKRGLDPLMENSQTFGLLLQCSFVYKGFCLWRVGNSASLTVDFLPVWLSADVRWQVKNEAFALWKICFWISL